MHRRTLLLFALFVVTAWFYASVADNSTDTVVDRHHKQVQVLEQLEDVLSGTGEAAPNQDQG